MMTIRKILLKLLLKKISRQSSCTILNEKILYFPLPIRCLLLTTCFYSRSRFLLAFPLSAFPTPIGMLPFYYPNPYPSVPFPYPSGYHHSFYLVLAILPLPYPYFYQADPAPIPSFMFRLPYPFFPVAFAVPLPSQMLPPLYPICPQDTSIPPLETPILTQDTVFPTQTKKRPAIKKVFPLKEKMIYLFINLWNDHNKQFLTQETFIKNLNAVFEPYNHMDNIEPILLKVQIIFIKAPAGIKIKSKGYQDMFNKFSDTLHVLKKEASLILKSSLNINKDYEALLTSLKNENVRLVIDETNTSNESLTIKDYISMLKKTYKTIVKNPNITIKPVINHNLSKLDLDTLDAAYIHCTLDDMKAKKAKRLAIIKQEVDLERKMERKNQALEKKKRKK